MPHIISAKDSFTLELDGEFLRESGRKDHGVVNKVYGNGVSRIDGTRVGCTNGY